MKHNRLLFMLLFLVAVLASCTKDNNGGTEEPATPTLSVAPAGAIAFTAKATQTFDITVTTNQTSWDVTSSQAWCKVAKNGTKFTVSATPNTATTAPAPAVLTISAGKAPAVTINVTQAAGEVVYPATESDLKKAITKVWQFPPTSDYISLEFGQGNTYTILSKVEITKADVVKDFYLYTAKYTVSSDLHTLILTDFGQVKITSLTNAKTEFEVTQTGKPAVTLAVTNQTIDNPATSSDKKIKRFISTDEGEEMTLDYVYTNGKLTAVNAAMTSEQGKQSLNVPILYEGNTVKFEFDGEIAYGKPGKFKITYTLGSSGLATSCKVENGDDYSMLYYTYNTSRQLISTRRIDESGKLISYCNATWVGGNIVSTYTWSTHVCNGGYTQNGDDKFYHHDHNQDGVYTPADNKTFDTHTIAYKYTNIPNKGGYMLSMNIPEVYMQDFADNIAQWAGILGVSYKNLLAQNSNEDGDFSYVLDGDGYPVKLNVSYPTTPEDNWSATLVFE